MSKKQQPDSQAAFSSSSYFAALNQPQDWQERIGVVAQRFNREYSGEKPELPDEVQEMPIFQEKKAGLLQAKLNSPFWQLALPQKNQRCLDIGCGVSFLIYPWRDWNALFYGQEVSTVARDILNTRSPQLNSKLFKGVKLGAAHMLEYEAGFFDLAIATGVSCYYPAAYWVEVLAAVKKILKPGGFFVFDVVDTEMASSENWAILETYLGAEVFLEPESVWNKVLHTAGAQSVKNLSGEIFRLHKVRFT